MNEFIEFRNHIYDDEDNYIYPLLFLEKYIKENKEVNAKESILIKRIKILKQIECKKSLDGEDLSQLLSYLGDFQYIDRFILDTILKYLNNDNKKILERIIKDIILEKEYNDQKLYHILDICIELDIDILLDSDILSLLEKFKLDYDLISILIDYIDNFKRDGFMDKIYKLLEFAYPDNIKFQILNLLVNLYSIEKVDQSFIRENIRNRKNAIFYDTYIDFLNTDLNFYKPGISLFQSIFYGEFEDSGKGNNGGLAVLLKDLGDELSKRGEVSFVFTITITENPTKAFMTYFGEKHVFIRLSIYLDLSLSDPFIKKELFIKRHIGNFLEKAGISPDIFHIRYLDNASKAVALLSKELNKKLVFTLTPDPHRNMFDQVGHLKKIDFNELIEKLNKIKIGDELIYISDGIVGIGDSAVEKELEIYFPQFKDKDIKKKIKMISEGIQIDNSNNHDSPSKFIDLSEGKEDFFEKPIILNVGRLSVLKGQVELLKAWANSRLSTSHNLLIIGGDLENPSKEEKMAMDFFKDFSENNPELKDRFIHKGAMSNKNIRLLEMSIIDKPLDLPHIYLCSSLKEEFGIAILEAMSKGFLTIGPIKGGVKSYLKNEENGFLIDTSNWKSISEDSEKYIYNSNIDGEGFKKIQDKGQKTVEDHYSMNKISKDFLSFYLAVKGGKGDEI